MKYQNPILSGCYPDPSICRVGEDYYLVTSSFEFFPGIPIFHSKDLLHWKQIGHCITREHQMSLQTGLLNLTGIYAPTIRYNEGIFYVISTRMSVGVTGSKAENFFVWTKDPYGEWSDPVWLDTPGIDPSLYFDEDGKVYYTGSCDGIGFGEIDLDTGKLKKDISIIWEGTGGSAPEGPHIYKINGWYYLLISEGGTEYGHMLTIARSKNIDGPYEAYDGNPILTNRSKALTLAAIGHADLTQDSLGNWWAVCLGNRPISYPYRHNLGRETMLIPVKWNEDGWPVMGQDGTIDAEVEVDCLPCGISETESPKTVCIKDYFESEQLDFSWNTLYTSISDLRESGKGLVLFGNEKTLSDADVCAWVGRRQAHHECKVRIKLEFERSCDGEEAGLTIYMNHLHHYEIALAKESGVNCIIFRRRIGSLWKVENKVPCFADEIIFEMEATKAAYIFRYSVDGKTFEKIGEGEAQYLTTEVGGVFTGNYIAMYACGNGQKCTNGAKFKWFEYKGESV